MTGNQILCALANAKDGMEEKEFEDAISLSRLHLAVACKYAIREGDRFRITELGRKAIFPEEAMTCTLCNGSTGLPYIIINVSPYRVLLRKDGNGELVIAHRKKDREWYVGDHRLLLGVNPENL